jgi:hypothetical protein
MNDPFYGWWSCSEGRLSDCVDNTKEILLTDQQVVNRCGGIGQAPLLAAANKMSISANWIVPVSFSNEELLQMSRGRVERDKKP